MKKLFFTSQSIQDLDEIHDYIAQKNPHNATQFIEYLHKKCETVASSPGIGVYRNELAKNLQCFPVQNYIIFYHQSEPSIEIIRVLHSARDIKSIFNEE